MLTEGRGGGKVHKEEPQAGGAAGGREVPGAEPWPRSSGQPLHICFSQQHCSPDVRGGGEQAEKTPLCTPNVSILFSGG